MNVGSVEYIASINTSQLSSDASKAEKIVDKSGATIQSSGKKTFSAFSRDAASAFDGVASGIAGLAKAASALFVGGAFGLAGFVKQASDLQGIQASFESMTGSAEEASKVLQQLNKFSFATAFSTKDINDAARTLLGAGIAVNDLQKTLSEIGDVAGATGADLGRLTLPLSQALSKGKLDTEDYYQILDSGAGKLGQALRQEVAERGLGNISDALSDGQVSAELFLSVLDKANNEGNFAFEGALKQSQTFAGQLSNLQETIGNVGLEILGVDKATGQIDPNGVFAKLSTTVQTATKFLSDNKEQIKQVASFIIDNAVPAIAALSAAFVVAKVAAIGFSIAASANAIGIIITAIAALIAALVFLQVKFNIFGQLFDFLREAGENIKSFIISTLANVIQFFFNAYNTITNLFKNVGSAIGSAIGNAFKSVVNSILKFAVGKINDFINAINGAISLINKIPGVNIGKIGTLPIPQLANGGIVTSPTLAMIGEGRESEAVIPLSKLDKMINNGGSGSNSNIEIGTINIGTEVDGDRWLKRLTGHDNIVNRGLTPQVGK